MNIKKIIKRMGFVLIVFPIFMMCMILNVIFWVLGVIWCPIYWILTGKDPLIEEHAIFYNIGEFIWNWYVKITNIEVII